MVRPPLHEAGGVGNALALTMSSRRLTSAAPPGDPTGLDPDFWSVDVDFGSVDVKEEQSMPRLSRAIIGGVLAAVCLGVAAYAQQPSPPPFATTKVDGTDNVYIFRYGGHQSMFIVTPAGVIATDPISERRPAKPYIDAIQAVTKAPIKYVVYSHSHFDHIAGGKPFKDLGATFVAHKNAKARIAALKPDDVVIPDQVVDSKRNITLGGTTHELNYVVKNHSDNTLVMRLPKEKIIFTVDWIPIQGIQFRGMADTYVPDIEESL